MAVEDFTPGTWSAQDCMARGEGYAVASDHEFGGKSHPYKVYVAQFVNVRDIDLFSAAKELYFALDQLLDDMGDDGLSVCQAAKDQAKAALAKARGDSI
tara:strand:- start:105 stop:401 length:297 start_codon:yes stop_codon:yes gene_type:complete